MTSSDDSDEYEDDDYTDKHSPTPKVLTAVRTNVLHQEPKPCQYDPCLENQKPCEEQSGCLCPGLSRADEPPHPPRIKALLPVNAGENQGKIEVQWCAPSSVVFSYRVVVEGRDRGDLNFDAELRRGLLESVEVGTKVCVEAVNTAGSSTPSDFSCRRYDSPESSNHKVFAWVVGGGVVLLLLLVIAAVILWKHKMCQRPKRNAADGLGNPSYSTEGTL